MLRTQHSGAFLLVEGVDDARFFTTRTDSRRCRLVLAGGRENVLGAIAVLDRASFKGALGAVDADFDRIIGAGTAPAPNLAVTDTHDLEMMLIQSPALERLLAE